jgi:hypothetical protein
MRITQYGWSILAVALVLIVSTVYRFRASDEDLYPVACVPITVTQDAHPTAILPAPAFHFTPLNPPAAPPVSPPVHPPLMPPIHPPVSSPVLAPESALLDLRPFVCPPVAPPPVAPPPQIHPNARGMTECARHVISSAQSSNLPIAAKDLLVLATSLMTDATKDQYMRMLTSIPLRFDSAESVFRALGTHSPCLRATASSVAICAIQSSSGPLLQQWIIHHLALGVDKIYLMNHEDAFPEYTEAALKPFIHAGYVHVYTYPTPREEFPQLKVYQYCHSLAKAGKHTWMGVIDVDEYWMASKVYDAEITPDEPMISNDTVHCISSYLDRYLDFGGVVFPWRFLSSIGTPYHDYSKTIFDQYPREHKHSPLHVKSFYNLKFLGKVGHVHFSTNYTQNKTSVNVEYRIENDFYVRNLSSPAYSDYAELRHYWGMSLLENIYFKICGTSWERRFARGSRIDILLEMLRAAETSKVADPVPPGYATLLRKLLGIS